MHSYVAWYQYYYQQQAQGQGAQAAPGQAAAPPPPSDAAPPPPPADAAPPPPMGAPAAPGSGYNAVCNDVSRTVLTRPHTDTHIGSPSTWSLSRKMARGPRLARWVRTGEDGRGRVRTGEDG